MRIERTRVALGAVAAALGAAALGGCSPVETRAGYEGTSSRFPSAYTASAMGAAASTADVGAGALAELPAAAGEIVAVVQNDAHFILTQRIVLRGDPGVSGENAIVVKVNNDPGPWDIDGPVGLPTKAMIAGELDAGFPGVEMRLSETFARNSFGPFGYAIGHPTPSVTCIYAWEFGIWKMSNKLDAEPSGPPSMPLRPTSVRVRLCRSKIGEAEILPMLRDMQVYPQGSRVAYSDPSFAGATDVGGDALSAAGVNYFVVPGARPARLRAAPAPRLREVAEAEPAPRRRERRHAEHHARRRHHDYAERREERAVAEDPPMRDAVAVPMPGGAPVQAAAPVGNPLLAPLARVARPTAAPVEDMPLPARAAAAPRLAPAPARPSSSIPLPN